MNTKERGIRVVLVGMGFGAEFAPIYRDHPDVAWVALSDPNADRLAETCARFGIERSYSTLEEALADPEVDAVHLVTPIPLHADQSVKVLEARKHCACTVPMATTLDDLHRIVAAQRASGKSYMMMETAVYTREFLMIAERYRNGDFGTISFARGSHMQDMEGWPDYWMGLPPHHYMTHAIAPVLRLTGKRVKKVHCFGSGLLPEERRARYGNPFPVETAIFRLEDSPVAVEVTRSLFNTARSYSEAFSIYGEQLGFEWQQIEEEPPVIYSVAPSSDGRGRKIVHQTVLPPDRQDLLPPEIAHFTQKSVFSDGKHLSFVQGGGHSGSHPHLVHEFVRAIVERRAPAIDAITAANWTAPGIAAHMSAMSDGAAVEVPDFG